MENNQNAEMFIAGFTAGYWQGRQDVIQEIKSTESALDRNWVNKITTSGLAKEAFQKYVDPKKHDFEKSCKEGDDRFADWARENLGWDLRTTRIPAGVSKSIPAMRAYFEGRGFYIDDKKQEKKLDADSVRDLLEDMNIIRLSGLRCTLQDFVTKNIKIEDDEGHIFFWWQEKKTLCLARDIAQNGEIRNTFRSAALLPKSEQIGGAKCTLRAEEIATYIARKEIKDKIRWMWDHAKMTDTVVGILRGN